MATSLRDCSCVAWSHWEKSQQDCSHVAWIQRDPLGETGTGLGLSREGKLRLMEGGVVARGLWGAQPRGWSAGKGL